MHGYRELIYITENYLIIIHNCLCHFQRNTISTLISLIAWTQLWLIFVPYMYMYFTSKGINCMHEVQSCKFCQCRISYLVHLVFVLTQIQLTIHACMATYMHWNITLLNYTLAYTTVLRNLSARTNDGDSKTFVGTSNEPTSVTDETAIGLYKEQQAVILHILCIRPSIFNHPLKFQFDLH